MSGSRSLPLQYCPYCGEQDLHPREDPEGAWECADCRSTFVVTAVPAPARGSA
jgi:ribosomal protein L37AE/L43A